MDNYGKVNYGYLGIIMDNYGKVNYGYLGNVYMSRASPDSYPVFSVSSKGIEGEGEAIGEWRRCLMGIGSFSKHDGNLNGDVLRNRIIVHTKQRERIISSLNGLINNFN